MVMSRAPRAYAGEASAAFVMGFCRPQMMLMSTRSRGISPPAGHADDDMMTYARER